MRVFVTGASGLIGKAVTKERLDAGHTVLGLAHSDKAAEVLTALGADVKRGSLYDLNALKEGAAASDGVIHLAFVHDFTNFAQSCQIDEEAIQAMGSVLAGSNRPLIITYRLALEKTSYGSIFYVVVEEGVKIKDIAEIIGKRLGLPVESKSMEEAQGHFGPFFAHLVSVNNPTSSKMTREVLGWNPRECTSLADLQDGKYVNA